MKNIYKKLIASVLSLAMIFSLCTQAFAAGNITAIGEEREAAVPQKPDYLAFAEKTYAELNQSINEAAFYGRINNVRRLTNYFALSAILYKHTGKQEYLDNAKTAFKVIITEWRRSPRNITTTGDQFFTDGFLTKGLEILGDELDLDTQTQLLIRADIRKNASALQMTDDNQGFARAEGALRASILFPKDPYAASWKKYANDVWMLWENKYDSDENAANYNAIAAFELIQLAKMLDKENVFLEPEARDSLFERLYAQVTNFGLMPEYGDDYYGEWATFIPVFEYAAKIYEDPKFLYAAWKMFAAGTKNFPHKPLAEGTNSRKADADLWTMQSLYYIAFVLEMDTYDAENIAQPEASPVVTMRRNENKEEKYNKIMLSASSDIGAPFAFMELYADGAHGHYNRVGSIGHYEAGGIPQFYGAARHNRSHVHSNVFAMMPSNIEFPMFDDIKIKPDEWVNESVSLRMLNSFPGKDKNYRFISRVLVRLNANGLKSNYGFEIDNLRFEGPKGTLMLDDFEDISGWVRSDTPFSYTDHHTEGSKAMHITVKPDSGYFYYSPYYNVEIDLSEYDTLKYDWCYQSPTGKMDFQGVFRLFDVGISSARVVDMNYGDINMKPNIDDVRVRKEGMDSFCDLTLSSYATYDSSLKRRVALLDEGVMIIQDNIDVGTAADGYNMGPIWHQLSKPDASGENWFNAKSDFNKKWYAWSDGRELLQNDLLVWFEKQEGAEYASTEGVLITNNPTTTYAAYTKAQAKAGDQKTFITVLYPHRNADAKAVADSISSHTSSQYNSRVEYVSGDKKVTVDFTENDIKVTRAKIR